MSDQRRETSAEAAEAGLKIVDRRRFGQDGKPVEEEVQQPAVQPGEARPAPAPQDDRDAQLAAQASRIDELSRAYAALLEDNKAFRQRLEREKARVVEAERVGVAQSLLDAADDLERALAAVSGAGEAQGEALRNLLEGVRMSLSALHRRIGEMGAQRLAVVGQAFDPRLAEAVDTITVGDASQDGVVLQEIRPGYRIGERILRPARVRVGRLARA